MELNSIMTIYLEIINKHEVSFRDLKEKKIDKKIVKEMLNLHMIDISSNSRVINPIYIMGDLNKLYETCLKIDDYKIKEIINRYLFLNGFITLPLCLELLMMAFKKRDYDFLFEVLFKIKDMYKENAEIKEEITTLLYELSFITKLPPLLNEQIANYKKEKKTCILLSDINDKVRDAKKLLFSKRDKDISRLLNNNDFLLLKNYLENEESKCGNLRKSDKLILYITTQIIKFLKTKKLETSVSSSNSLESLIYSNNFKKAYKMVKRKLGRKSFEIDNNLYEILERINYFLDNRDILEAENNDALLQIIGKSYGKLV